jgi:hypothetical protein
MIWSSLIAQAGRSEIFSSPTAAPRADKSSRSELAQTQAIPKPLSANARSSSSPERRPSFVEPTAAPAPASAAAVPSPAAPASKLIPAPAMGLEGATPPTSLPRAGVEKTAKKHPSPTRQSQLQASPERSHGDAASTVAHAQVEAGLNSTWVRFCSSHSSPLLLRLRRNGVQCDASITVHAKRATAARENRQSREEWLCGVRDTCSKGLCAKEARGSTFDERSYERRQRADRALFGLPVIFARAEAHPERAAPGPKGQPRVSDAQGAAVSGARANTVAAAAAAQGDRDVNVALRRGAKIRLAAKPSAHRAGECELRRH